MSLPDVETPAPVLADLLEAVSALHSETHEVLRLVRAHDALLEQFRPVLDRYAAATGSAAARWARAKARNQRDPAHVTGCQGIAHDPIPGCTRIGSHSWHASVGCHANPGECND
jgi:hypothetical protein